MNTIDEKGFAQVCESVWRDRTAILFWSGSLCGEDALIQALYWRLRKVGYNPEQSFSDYAAFLKKFLRRYQEEVALCGKGSREMDRSGA
jgi:hypothetical protein